MPASDLTNEHEVSPTPSTDAVAEASTPDTFDAFDETPTALGNDRAVTFRLASQLYGLPLHVVREIQQIAELLPLPDNDPALVGLIELRGVIVPVLDLRALVGLEEAAYTLETPMVFCYAGTRQVCLIVDSVEDVVDLPPDSVQPASSIYTLADRMLGTVRLEQGVLILLDIERLVPARIIAAAEAREAVAR